MVQISNTLSETTGTSSLQSSSVQTKVDKTATSSQSKDNIQQPSASAAYSVEISEEGARLSSLSSAASSNVSSAVSAVRTQSGSGSDSVAKADDAGTTPAYSVKISEEGARLSSAGPSLAAVTNSAETDSSGTTSTDTTASNLSQYSDSQLQQMLSEGKITQSEYNAEIAKRETQEQNAANADTGIAATNKADFENK